MAKNDNILSDQIFKKRAWQNQFLEGIAGKEGGWLFSGGYSFYIKSKLKSEIFNNKFISKNVFLCQN